MTTLETAHGFIRWSKRETVMLHQEIRTGRFKRSMAVITGISAVVSGIEAYTQHRRGAFAHPLMWTPVWLMPPAAAAAGAAVFDERAARKFLPAISAVVILDGIVGFVYHVRGIRRMPGAFRLGQYNIVMGPPVFAPLLLCSVGVAGVLSSRLQYSRGPEKLTSAVRRGIAALLRSFLAPKRAPDRLFPVRRTAARSRTFEDGPADGRLQRGLAVTTAVLGAAAGGEAYFEHLRGSFNNRLMWTPIWLTPPMVIAAAGAAVSDRVARHVLPVASAVTMADGVLGFALHMRGLHRMPGDSANLEFKIAMGPPLFAPLLFAAVGMFGLVVSLLRPARDA